MHRTRFWTALFLLLCLVVAGTTLSAQERNLSEVIDVVRPYKPILAEPLKIKTNPELNDNEALKPDIAYKVKPIKLDTINAGNLLTAEKVKTESIAKLYRLYLKAGLGTHLNNIGDVYFNNIQSKSWQYGFLFHQLGGDGILANTQTNENKANIYAKKIFTNASWSANLGYDHRALNFYGYDHDDTAFTRKDVRQRFNTFSAGTEVLTHIRESEGLNMGFNTDVYHTYSHRGAFENGLKSNLFFDKPFYENTINVPIAVDLSHYSDSLTQNNLLVKFAPSFAKRIDSAFSFRVGANFVFEQLNKGQLHFYPVASVEYKLVPRYLIAQAGITGDVHKTSLRSITSENPFVQSRISLKNMNEKISLYGALMSSPQRFFIKAFVKYSFIDNLLLFVNDSSDTKRLVPVYDGKNATRTNFVLDISYNVSEKLRLGTKGDFNSYSTSSEIKAWNKPEMLLTGTFSYTIAKKFIANAHVFYIGSRKARYSTATQNYTTLKPVTDLNVDLEYRYSKTLSVFTRFDNIRGVGYDQWLYYPTYGFNFIAGLTFAL